MSALKQVMQVIGSHHISNRLLNSDYDKCGGLITNGQYAWFVSGANIILYSKQLGCVVSSRSFADNQKDKSLKITYIKELKNNEETCNLILVGCSFKSSGLLFVCQLPTLTTIRCIGIPSPITYIAIIMNEPLAKDQLCDEFKVMSTILLIGMNTGAIYAVDLRQNHIENQLKRNEVVVNESRPNKLFIMRKGENCAEVKEMSDDSDSHLAIFLNENFYSCCKKLFSAKFNLKVSSLLYIDEINTIAFGYSTGHFQLWDCKIMHTIFSLKEPKCVMPITHINFLEPSDDPNNLCYLWIMQSDNTRLPNATMIALTYEQRTVMPNGCLSYRKLEGSGIKLEMSLKRETGIGRCISALSLCNVNLFRNETDIDEDCEIRLFSMLMEVRQNADADPESYIFLFDINQWYKAQMPSNINDLKVSNSYASFVKLPHNVNYLDFNISDKTLRPFGCNLRNNVEELYYPSSIYFECDCLVDTEIIRFKHAGVQQEILDQLLLKSWRLLINPSLIFNQCLQTNLRPFFWDKSDDYIDYSLPDQRSFVISILVENKIMSVLSACAEKWKNGTYASSEATILHLVQCLWKHVMVVKQYADKLCVPLFDYSGTRLDKKNERILNHCLSQMQCVKHFLEDLHIAYGVHIINVDYSYRVYTLNLVTQYFKAVLCFISYGLLPESIEQDPMQSLIQCDFTRLIQYANKRRMEFGDSQLYLIDAIVNNEPKGNKLIEQWQHEGGEETKGMYPPSNVQCLLRIYLNASLSDQMKDFITIYFLIDVCSMKKLDVIVANRMCNFALEFDVPNKGLNTLCRASWLLDHDMFEEAMEILAENKEWRIINDKSWDWFHWVVLKLLVFKSEYFWARYYMKLININIVNIDDHKFYINLQIMNDQTFDAIHYIRARSLKEKQILFEYFFNRCKEINKLKCLIEYPWEKEEEDLFFSYLEKFEDAESLTFKLLFLLQRGKYLEAIDLNKSVVVVNKLKFNETLKITSNLVNGFEKSLPKSIREKSYGHPQFQNIYKKRDIIVKCMNSDSKMFSITDTKKENIFEKRNSSSMSSNLINLIIPANTNIRKRSPTNEVVHNEKRRKINDDDVPNSPKTDENKILRPIGKQVLDILNTPLVEKTIISPSVTSCSSILKTGSAKKHKRVLTIKDNEMPVSRTILRFSLPGENDTKDVLFDSENSTNLKTNQLNESISNNELSNTNIKQQISNSLIESSSDNSTKKTLNSIAITDEKNNSEDEEMDISEYNYEPEEVDDIIRQVIARKKLQIPENNQEIVLLSDDDEEKESAVSKSKLENTNLILNEDSETSIEILSSSNDENKADVSLQSVQMDKEKSLSPQLITMKPLIVDHSEPNTRDNLSNREGSRSYNENIFFPSATIKSNDTDYMKEHISDDDDNDVIVLNSEDENSASDRSSSINSSDDHSVSDESDFNNTRYGRFKSHKRESSEDTCEERSNVSEEEDDEQIDVEQSGGFSEDNLSIEGEICSEDEIISSEGEEEKINLEQCDVSSDEDKANSVELQNDEYYENSREENNFKQDYVEISDESEEANNLKSNDESEEANNLKSNDESEEANNLKSNDESEEVNNLKSNDENNLEQYNTKFNYKNKNNDENQQNVLYLIESDENDSERNDLSFDKGVEQNLVNENDKSCDLSVNEDYDLKSNKLENLTSCSFDLNEENDQPNFSCINENVKTANYNDIVVSDEKSIDTNIKDHESNKVVNKISLENKSIDFEEVKNSEIHINPVENVSINVQEEYSFANNDNYFEMSNRESSPIPDNGFNLPATEIEPNQMKMFELDTNQSTPFLFGESFFGQQEIPENKPMFLFGQVYSFEKEKIAVDSNNDKDELKDSVLDNDKNDVINNESEEIVDLDDEIEDILELESLPESNPDPDDNSDVQKSLRTNILQPEYKESDKAFEQSILLNNLQKSTDSNSQNINIVQVFENQKTEISVEFSSPKITKNLNKNSYNQLCESFQLEKQTFGTDNILQNNDELNQNMNTIETAKLSCDINDDNKNKEISSAVSPSIDIIKLNSKPRKYTKAMSEQKELNKIGAQSKRSQSVPADSKMEYAQLIENEKSFETKKNDIPNYLSNQTFNEASNTHSKSISSSHKLPTVIRNESIITLQQSNSGIIDSTIAESTITSLSENKLCDDIKTQEKNKDELTSIINKSIPENKLSPIKQSLNIAHCPEMLNKEIKGTPYVCLEQLSSQQVKLIENKLRRSIRSKSEQPCDKTAGETKNITLQLVDSSVDEKTNKVQKLEGTISQEERNAYFDASLKNKPSFENEVNLTNQNLNTKQYLDIKNDKEITCISQEQPSTSNEQKLRRSRRSKSEQSLDKITVELKDPFVSLDPQFNKFGQVQKVSHEKEQLFEVKTSEYEDNQEITQKSSRRKSLRKHVSKANESISGSLDDISQETTYNIKQLSDQTEEGTQKISNSQVNKQIDEHAINQDNRKRKAKSIPPQNLDIIKTRSRAKSETNIVQSESSSSYIFRSSGIIDDNKRVVRVSLSKKRSKSQENVASTKRRSGRSKSLAPKEETTNIRRTVFGLEQIPEEETTNSDKNVQFKHAAITRKSKFNFSSNKSKIVEHKNTSLNVQDKKVKTPIRSKSVQPETALTFSLVKTKPKRSSSVNLLISDDTNSTKIDNFMGVLKKALVSPVKIKKRSLTESVESRKKQKYTKQVESENVESDSIHSNDFDSSPSEEFSPIAGNNSQHMLFTPAKRQTKIHMATLDSENENSENESTDSKRIITRSTIRKNSSDMELELVSATPNTKKNSKILLNKQKSTSEIQKSSKKISGKVDKNISLLPKRGIKSIKETIVEESRNEPSTPERRITRSQKSILDSSLQSTSIIGQDEVIQNVPTPKSEKKIKKKRNQKDLITKH